MRKNIIVGMLIIAVAAALLGGATFAWFTDLDKTDNHTFSAGTLDVALTDNEVGFTLEKLAPGYVTVDPWVITIANSGTLDMYYTVYFEGTDTPGDSKTGELSDELLVAVKLNGSDFITFEDDVTLAELIDQTVDEFFKKDSNMINSTEAAHTLGLMFKLPDTVGSDFQGASFTGTLNVKATQVDYQSATIVWDE